MSAELKTAEQLTREYKERANAKRADEEARRPPTLRDRFAMAALTGLVSHAGSNVDADMFAAQADEIADAMMQRRKEPK